MSRVIRRVGFLLGAAIIVFSTTKVLAGSAAMTSAQLALYQGADREKVLIEGAKREGQFTLYTSHTWFRTLVKDFEKKYPFIKASEWRNDSKNVIRKVLEEVKAGRIIVDVVETTADGMGVMKRYSKSIILRGCVTTPMSSNQEEKTDSSIYRTVRLTIASASTPLSFQPPRPRET